MPCAWSVTSGSRVQGMVTASRLSDAPLMNTPNGRGGPAQSGGRRGCEWTKHEEATALARAVESCSSGQAHAIVSSRVDRLARSSLDFARNRVFFARNRVLFDARARLPHRVRLRQYRSFCRVKGLTILFGTPDKDGLLVRYGEWCSASATRAWSSHLGRPHALILAAPQVARPRTVRPATYATPEGLVRLPHCRRPDRALLRVRPHPRTS
jgi:hypothetical protein